MVVLFVGDKPSKNSHPTIAFKGAKCEARLKEWISYILKDIHSDEYFVHIINRIDIRLVTHIRLCEIFHNPVIALGNNASKALKNTKHFKLPHPSGRNRKLNDKFWVAVELERCKEYVRTFRHL